MTIRLGIRLLVPTLYAAGALSASAAALWLDVPFVRQPSEGCGAAAISMVLQYWAAQDRQPAGPAADVDRIQSALFVPEENGIRASAMESYFWQQGFRVFAFSAEWSDLEHHLERGRPLIVCLAPEGHGQPLHYSVVTGIDTERNYVFLNDPARGKLMRASREAFLREWNTAANWTLLALPWAND